MHNLTRTLVNKASKTANVFTKKRLVGAVSLFLLLTVAFYIGQMNASSSDEIIISPDYSFWKSVGIVVGKVSSTFYAVSGTTGASLYSNSSDDLVLQYAIDAESVSGGSVGVKSAAYSASITLKTGVRLILEKGATGITVSVNAGATCILEDHNAGRTRSYSSGVLTWDEDQESGKITTDFGNFTTIYVASIENATVGGNVQILKLVVENGTSFPASPSNNQVFLRNKVLYAYDGSDWIAVGFRDYANLTGTPDLTVYMLTDGSRALTANWNVGNYGIYGVTWLNATNISINGTFWLK